MRAQKGVALEGVKAKGVEVLAEGSRYVEILERVVRAD
jgi:hypothetical protein